MIIDDHWWSTINFEACLFSKPCKFSDVQTALLKAQQNTIVPMDSARMLYFPKSKITHDYPYINQITKWE